MRTFIKITIPALAMLVAALTIWFTAAHYSSVRVPTSRLDEDMVRFYAGRATALEQEAQEALARKDYYSYDQAELAKKIALQMAEKHRTEYNGALAVRLSRALADTHDSALFNKAYDAQKLQ